MRPRLFWVAFHPTTTPGSFYEESTTHTLGKSFRTPKPNTQNSPPTGEFDITSERGLTPSRVSSVRTTAGTLLEEIKEMTTDGVSAIRDALSQLDPGSIVLCSLVGLVGASTLVCSHYVAHHPDYLRSPNQSTQSQGGDALHELLAPGFQQVRVLLE
jgi:hypothetical protein